MWLNKPRREAVALRVDVADVWRAEMLREQQRAGTCAFFQRHAPRCARFWLIDTREAVPARVIDLDDVMDDVAREIGLLAPRGEIDQHVAGRMPGRGGEREMLLDGFGAVDHLRETRLDNRVDAVAHRAADGGLVRIAVESGEMIEVGLAPDVL